MTEESTALAMLKNKSGADRAALSALSAGATSLKQNATAAGGVAPGQQRGGKQYAKFDGNTGSLTFGRNNMPVPEDQKFCIPVGGLFHGWIYWANKKPERDTEVMVSAFDAFPEKPDGRPTSGSLPKPREREGWTQTYVVTMFGFEDEMNDIEMELPGGSLGVQQFWGDAAMAMHAQYESGEQEFIHPIVKIVIGDYLHKEFNRTVYKPVFELLGWTNFSEVRMLDAEAGTGEVLDEDDILS